MVQLFTNAVDAVRKLETKQRAMPKNTRWTVLMAQERNRTAGQADALRELVEGGFATAKAYRVKSSCAGSVRQKPKGQHGGALPTFSGMPRYAGESPLLEPVRKALASFQRHLPRIIHRWHSLHTNARLEGLNGLFQAARARARGYRNVDNFIAMAYLIAAPIQELIAIN